MARPGQLSGRSGAGAGPSHVANEHRASALSTVSAFDLGFITRPDMIDRLEKVFRSLERMRRFHGHFFNWYDLSELRVLEPAYVSTVDSGNFAGHLLALKQACFEILKDPS